MVTMIIVVAIWIALGFVTAKIAESKGRPFGEWLIYGFLCFPLAILYLVVAGEGRTRKCPYCAEMVKEEAKICRYCGKELPVIEHKDEPMGAVKQSIGGIAALLIVLLIFSVIAVTVAGLFQ